jgi:Na+/phosphate symporter
LAVGIGIETIVTGYLYLVLNYGYSLPLTALVFSFSPILTIVGLFVLWIGRHEWNKIGRSRFRLAGFTFGLTVLSSALATGIVFWYGYVSVGRIPAAASVEFNIVSWAALIFLISTYAFIAFHLSGALGKAFLVLAVTWAIIVTFWIAQALTAELGVIVHVAQLRTLNFGRVESPILGYLSDLAPTYLLLLIAYLDALRRTAPSSRRIWPFSRFSHTT